MRTLRLSLAGTVSLVLLLGVGASGLAQDEEPPENSDWLKSTIFTGTETCKVVGFGERTEEDITRQRGFTSECLEEMSDLRVSGVNTVAWDSDCYPFIGCVSWGTFELAGPDGVWVGTFTGTSPHGEQDSMMTTATGSGTDAYEGWAYVSHSSSPDPYVKGTVDGFIYLRDPPANLAIEVPPTE